MKTKEECLAECFCEIDVSGYIEEPAKLVLDAMDAYANQSRWISVEERLPEERGELVLAFFRYQDEDIIDTVMFFDKDTWSAMVGYDEFHAEVTHWQPLPEKPI